MLPQAAAGIIVHAAGSGSSDRAGMSMQPVYTLEQRWWPGRNASCPPIQQIGMHQPAASFSPAV
ncbi:MAG: hypothetical protein ACE5IK_08875 [Acidobacteriota bacterium]